MFHTWLRRQAKRVKTKIHMNFCLNTRCQLFAPTQGTKSLDFQKSFRSNSLSHLNFHENLKLWRLLIRWSEWKTEENNRKNKRQVINRRREVTYFSSLFPFEVQPFNCLEIPFLEHNSKNQNFKFWKLWIVSLEISHWFCNLCSNWCTKGHL